MYAKVLLAAVAALAVTSPVLAKSKAAAADANLPTGPVPYSDLAAVDAKMNPPAGVAKKKHHAVHHAAAKASAAAPADAKAAPKP